MNHIFSKEFLARKLISTYFLLITNVMICIHMARLRPVKMVVCNYPFSAQYLDFGSMHWFGKFVPQNCFGIQYCNHCTLFIVDKGKFENTMISIKKHMSKVLFRLSVEKGQTHGIFKSDFTFKNSTIIIP